MDLDKSQLQTDEKADDSIASKPSAKVRQYDYGATTGYHLLLYSKVDYESTNIF